MPNNILVDFIVKCLIPFKKLLPLTISIILITNTTIIGEAIIIINTHKNILEIILISLIMKNPILLLIRYYAYIYIECI